MNYGAKDAANTQAFPVYRESLNKIYLPRFYGIEKYGVPKNEKLQIGDTINVYFAKQLRDYQENIVSIYMEHVGKKLTSNSDANCNGCLLYTSDAADD